MSQKRTHEIACPFCGREQNVELWDSINVDSEPELRARLEAPIERVTGWDTPYPHAQEWMYFPGPDRVGEALRRTVDAGRS